MIGNTDETFIKPIVRVPYPDRGLWLSLLKPGADVTLSRPFEASAEHYGDGVRAVANKPSEHNMLTVPVFFHTRQLPGPEFSTFTPRLISHNIGG